MKKRLIALMIAMLLMVSATTSCGEKQDVEETQEFVRIQSSEICADEVVVKYEKEAQHHVGQVYDIVGEDYQGQTKNGKQFKLKCGKEIVTSDPVTIAGGVKKHAFRTQQMNPELLCEECFDEYLVDSTVNQ